MMTIGDRIGYKIPLFINIVIFEIGLSRLHDAGNG